MPFSAAELAAAARRAGQDGVRLVEVLARPDGAAASDDFPARLAATVGLTRLTAAELFALAPDFDGLSFDEALRREALLGRDAGGHTVLAVADPFDTDLVDGLGARLLHPFVVRLADRDDLTACLARHEESRRVVAGMLAGREEATTGDAGEDLSLRRIAGDASPVVKLVNSTLYDAIKQGASDVHLESVPGGLVIKYRVDGVLARVGGVQGTELAEQAVSRLKVMAELDIAERRVPQDGRFKVQVSGRPIDFRVSIMPSIHGEDAVLRILDKEHLTRELAGLTLETLGFDPAVRQQLRHMAGEPYGMLLVTGPTGSGKTTSLYATLSETNTGHDKIVTIEDPVEYQLPGVLQIPVNEKKGLSFARGLRSILRHDPDKIMVGEIRDAETAEIAVQAALTGHLVFTTVHANNVFDVIGRFMHMGIDPYNLVAALNGVVAQRLIRVNCPACSTASEPDAALLRESGLATPADVQGFAFRAGSGCGQCRGTGYRGRKAIAEVLLLDDELRDLIIARAPLRQLKDTARRRGFVSLREAGLQRVREGLTTLQELNRVTFVA
ncbi:MAG TPA: GspE/PulE family protein [Zoogloea sp.]|uniref:GspE/PulE family protein n=1 Tax=Zoogloea sp. TaxID=49181 RepID=UPI002C62A625|nr:GspE/PulE family protein [Zoogloea sp.]HNI49672.1 GspE/PulE family protein [Zoogloea sp.]